MKTCYDLWKKEKLIDLLAEKDHKIEEFERCIGLKSREAARYGVTSKKLLAENLELRTQTSLMAESLGKKEAENSDFNNSLVIEGSDSLRKIAEKVTESDEFDRQAAYSLKMNDAAAKHERDIINAQIRNNDLITKRQVEMHRLSMGELIERSKNSLKEQEYRYHGAVAAAKAERNRQIGWTISKTICTGIRWIIGAAALSGGFYMFLTH
jgi:hypothetical protein